MVQAALAPPAETTAIVDSGWIAQTASRILAVMENNRSTWQMWHVRAEAQRQIRTADVPVERARVLVDLLVDEVLDRRSIALVPPHDGIEEPDDLRRTNGSSVYNVAGSDLYTWQRILDAEQRLVATAGRRDGPVVDESAVDLALLEMAANRTVLDAGQAALVRQMCTSGARLQLAIAPAGAGKTTAMRALTLAWTQDRGQVLGPVPSPCGHLARSSRIRRRSGLAEVGNTRVDPGSPSPEQSVEAPVVGVHRENLNLAEAGLEGVLTKYRGTHNGSGGCGLRVSHGTGKARDHAPAVCNSFQRGGGDRELLGDQPVDHQQDPVLGKHLSGCAEYVNGSRHIMQGLEDHHKVVPARSAQVGGVSDGERHSISHASPFGVPASSANGVMVEIEAIHGDAGVRLSHCDARPTGAARHVENTRRRFGPKARLDVDNRREPFGAKQIDEHGPVSLLPALGPPRQRRRRVPHPKRLHQLWKPATAADDVDADVSLVSDVVGVCQDRNVLRRQPVPASQGFRPRVVDHEQLTRGVVLQPLPHVPLGGSRVCGQLRRRGRTAFCERSIQPESFTKIDGVEL
jgi:hypothetical protein